ncbi:FecR family protein [Parapedobacter koreensis]|uniref:FecR family protein n=1 Tax=Parapedobacter koreensis TaxID=332977 RepID=A0A1H7FR90_9SPHI|nr:FecR family protein [Parapedobacter koreensis]SEK28479.1 FecR family protein [Parapedobacter koreensis]
MDKKQFRQLLRDYLQGKLTKTRSRQVDEWFDAFGYDEDIEPLRDEEKANRIHESLASRLEAYTKSPKPVKRLFYGWLPRIAAVALLALLAAWWVWRLQGPQESSTKLNVAYEHLSFDTVRVGTGRMKRIELPDQSVVWLNANTQLRYAKQTFAQHRELFIDRGEAFFEVTRNPENPFTVRAEAVATKVLGTSFNVKSYPELDYVSVQVKTGKVSVSAQNGRLLDTVAAGHGLKYRKEEQAFEVEDRFATDAGSWMEGRTLLDNATFAELALVMQNRFGIRLQTQLPAATHFRYTMTILQQHPLDETMRLICDVHQTNYRRQGDEITIY